MFRIPPDVADAWLWSHHERDDAQACSGTTADECVDAQSLGDILDKCQPLLCRARAAAAAGIDDSSDLASALVATWRRDAKAGRTVSTGSLRA